jgi:translation initiation factor IF-1
MSKEEPIKTKGHIIDIQRDDNFRVKIIDSEQIIICKPSGRLRQHKIKLAQGDSVDVELSIYDLTKGRITYRNPV